MSMKRQASKQQFEQPAPTIGESKGDKSKFAPPDASLGLALREERQLTQNITPPAKIANDIEMGTVSAKLIEVTKARKAFEAKKKELCEPFKEGIAGISAEYDPFIERCKEYESKVRPMITMYRTEAQRKADEEQAKADELYRQQQAQARRARQNPLSVPRPAAPQGPPIGFTTAVGQTGVRKVKRWRAVDMAQIPYEHGGETLWVLNMTAIGKLRAQAAQDATSDIPGIEYYVEEVPVVS